MKNNKILLSIIFILAAGIMFMGLSKSDYYKNIAKSQKRINTIYKYLMSNYVDELDLDRFTKESIDNILLSVDPYTVYMVEEEKSDIELLTNNAYFGIGVQIGKREGFLTVISPMDEGPARRAGMISGDIIFTIDGTPTEHISIHEASKLIKGEKGTVVKLEIQREGESDLIPFDLERDEIIVKFVSYFGMLEDNTGYIRLTRFGKNAEKEMVNAIDSLLDQGAENIVLDLRDNTGGLLRSALEVLDMFIPKGELLLNTKGRVSGSNREYHSKNNPIVPESVKLAVLINGGSASASEIVAGTIQDLDRGILLGKTSFGKGLVQSIFALDNKSTLKITTAKYYTPSGRLIQKPGYVDSLMVKDNGIIQDGYFTSSGRPVSGGGGVEPDSTIELEKTGPLTQAVWRRGAFFTFVQKNKLNYGSFAELSADRELMENFHKYLDTINLNIILPGRTHFEDSKMALTAIDSSNTGLNSAFDDIETYFAEREQKLFAKEKDELSWRLLSEFLRIYDGREAGTAFSLKYDKTVSTAVTLFNSDDNYDKLVTFHSDN